MTTSLSTAHALDGDQPGQSGGSHPEAVSQQGAPRDRAAILARLGAARSDVTPQTIRSPERLTHELVRATEEGRTIRVSKEEYESLLAYNHARLGPIPFNWHQELGLSSEDLASGDRHRTINYNSIPGQSNAVPGFEHLHGADEVPAHLRGPDGGPLTVTRSSATYFNTGGGRYLPPEVSNSPDHHLSRLPGAAPGPQLRD